MTTDTILVVDFGAQYARLIARRVREAHVYSEIVSPTISVAEIKARAPKGIIFSGGPKSVYESPAPSIDAGVYELGIPILGLCYGAQLMALQLGGTVSRTGQGEYGRTELTQTGASPLCPDWPATSSVWMSHGDAITGVPDGFAATATSAGAPVAAMHDPERRLFGLQFHPEVVHTDRGSEVFDHFLIDVCGCLPGWTHVSIIEQQVAAVRAQVGTDRVLCALSGGVDSAVAAALVHKAVGDQLTCVFVDTGPHALRRGRSGRGHLPAPVQDGPRPREGGRPLLRRAGGRDRSRAQAQDHRRAVHPDLRGGGPRPGRRRPAQARPRRPAPARARASWCRARSTPT